MLKFTIKLRHLVIFFKYISKGIWTVFSVTPLCFTSPLLASLSPLFTYVNTQERPLCNSVSTSRHQLPMWETSSRLYGWANDYNPSLIHLFTDLFFKTFHSLLFHDCIHSASSTLVHYTVRKYPLITALHSVVWCWGVLPVKDHLVLLLSKHSWVYWVSLRGRTSKEQQTSL